MISSIISRLVILVFGTLYPAYASYKAVRTKNLKEYVKWMMYWIVFALFTCTETITDVFFSWFPFYYEVKIVLVLWLLSPATKGSSILYRKFVHPALCRREQEIDEYIAKAKDQGYHTVLNLGTKGVNYATTVIMQTAIKGGGGLVQQLRKSYSLSDLSECEPRAVEPASDEADDVLAEPRLIRRQVTKSVYSTRRSASESNSRAPLYFPEVDVEVRGARPTRDEHDFSHIKSSEDISSGYSSADNSGAQQLSRTGSAGARARARNTRTAITTIKRPTPAEDSEVIIEEMADDDTFDYANMPPLLKLPSPLFLSQTNPPFVYQCVGDQIKIVQVLGNIPMTNNTSNNDTESIEKDVNEKKDESVSNVTDDNCEIKVITENITELKEPHCGTNSDIPFHDSCTNKDASESENILNAPLMEERDSANDLNEAIAITNPQGDELHLNFNVRIDDDCLDSTSLDTTSFTENASAESDDEASYGTPDNSPRCRRKSPGIGKYGKRKAPSPPKVKINVEANRTDIVEPDAANTLLIGSENLNDILNSLVDFTEIPSTSKSLQVNPIAEKKRRHKSKSPGRIPKASNSTIGKLLQLPGKLSFWGKNTEISKSDSLSASSGDESQRFAVFEKLDNFNSSCDLYSESEVNLMTTTHEIEEPNDSIHFIDVGESETIPKDIIDKSDILKKLIEAKIQSHPEYKYISLHDEEIPTCSKSTEV